MTIQEAIKTGRKFWRPGANGTCEFHHDRTMTLDPVDILAEDWVVEPLKIEFECEWHSDAESGPSPIIMRDIEIKLEDIACRAKKTKVTVEVIND